MKLATVEYRGHVHAAVVDGDQLDILPAEAGSILSVLAAGRTIEPLETVARTAVIFLPPIPQPGKILCVGLNYRDHAEESARDVPEHPSLFARFSDSIVGHGQPIIRPSISSDFDYEGELAVVIGTPCWRVDAAGALAHVAGYSCFAENSVRDFQQHSRQVTAGKNFFASGAFGPWLTTPDDLGPLEDVRLTTRLNGVVMQQGSLSNLIYDIPTIIAYISQFTPLRPGDVIATGTPSGVGAARTPPIWMKPGDQLEVEVSGIGVLANPVRAEGTEGHPVEQGKA